MKTTLFCWDRVEGKSYEMFFALQQYDKSERILILELTYNEIARVKNMHPFLNDKDRNITMASFSQLSTGVTRGTRPTVIAIDNAEYLKNKLFVDEIKPMLPFVKELIMTGSDTNLFKHFRLPEDIKFKSHAKQILDDWSSGKMPTENAILKLKNFYKTFYGDTEESD